MVAKGRGGKKEPRRILAFTKAWKTATVAAGCPGRIPHDMRRTAVRNMIRRGVPERVAIELAGHKTRSVFDRYSGQRGRSEEGRRAALRPDRDNSGTVGDINARSARRNSQNCWLNLEAPPGFEPGMEVLQSSDDPKDN